MEKKDERDSPSLSPSSPPLLKTDASETSPEKEDQRVLPQSSLPPTTDIAAVASETTPLAAETKRSDLSRFTKDNGVSPKSPSPPSPPPLTTSESETNLSRLQQSLSESPPPPVPTQNNNSRNPENAVCRRLRLYSKKGYDLMVSMGYQGGGLGRYGQGITKPIEAKERKNRRGLGFTPEEPPLSQPTSTHYGIAQVSRKVTTEAVQPKLELDSTSSTNDETKPPQEPAHNPFSRSGYNMFLEPAEQANYLQYVASLESEQDRLRGYVPPESIEQEMLKLNKQQGGEVQGEVSEQVSQPQEATKKKPSKSSRRRMNQRNQNKNKGTKDEDDLPHKGPC